MEKFDYVGGAGRVGLNHYLPQICAFFSRLLLINISLILKLDASIMGLTSIDIQNNRK